MVHDINISDGDELGPLPDETIAATTNEPTANNATNIC